MEITDISKAGRPVEKPEKVKKASTQMRRIADLENILGVVEIGLGLFVLW